MNYVHFGKYENYDISIPDDPLTENPSESTVSVFADETVIGSEFPNENYVWFNDGAVNANPDINFIQDTIINEQLFLNYMIG